MPIGMMILSVSQLALKPIVFNIVVKDSRKKLKYLKYSKMLIPIKTPRILREDAFAGELAL